MKFIPNGDIFFTGTGNCISNFSWKSTRSEVSKFKTVEKSDARADKLFEEDKKLLFSFLRKISRNSFTFCKKLSKGWQGIACPWADQRQWSTWNLQRPWLLWSRSLVDTGHAVRLLFGYARYRYSYHRKANPKQGDYLRKRKTQNSFRRIKVH